MTKRTEKRVFDTLSLLIFIGAAIGTTIGTYGALHGGIENVFPWAVGVNIYAVSISAMFITVALWLIFRSRRSPFHIAP
jgi:hypothetical protein